MPRKAQPDRRQIDYVLRFIVDASHGAVGEILLT